MARSLLLVQRLDTSREKAVTPGRAWPASSCVQGRDCELLSTYILDRVLDAEQQRPYLVLGGCSKLQPERLKHLHIVLGQVLLEGWNEYRRTCASE